MTYLLLVFGFLPRAFACLAGAIRHKIMKIDITPKKLIRFMAGSAFTCAVFLGVTHFFDIDLPVWLAFLDEAIAVLIWFLLMINGYA